MELGGFLKILLKDNSETLQKQQKQTPTKCFFKLTPTKGVFGIAPEQNSRGSWTKLAKHLNFGVANSVEF
jgi:hypothetical protein